MTQTEAYIIHLQQARKIVQLFSVHINPNDLAKYAFAVNTIENARFDPNARNSNSSARGMMQMLTGTQKEIETKYLHVAHYPDNIFDARYAVYLGQFELARQFVRYNGSWRKSLHAYNRGSYNDANSKSTSYAAGELYANRVLNSFHNTDFAALNEEAGNDESSGYAQSSTQTKEWS